MLGRGTVPLDYSLVGRMLGCLGLYSGDSVARITVVEPRPIGAPLPGGADFGNSPMIQSSTNVALLIA